MTANFHECFSPAKFVIEKLCYIGFLKQREYSITATAEGDCSGCHLETVLHWFGLRHRAETDCGNSHVEDLQAPRQKHHLCRRWTFPLRTVLFEPNFFGKGTSGHRDTLLQNIMKCDIRKVARRCRVVG